MAFIRNRLFIITGLFLGGLFAGNALAASDSLKEGGIGGTGSPVMRGGIGGTGSPANSKGIGGTGSPAMNGGIGGTGLRPNDESATLAFAGRVLFIIGQAEAQNQGQTRVLAKGDSVRAGDILKSGKGATVQLRMEDGGTIVLRPETQLAIEAFSYKGVQDGSERMALALMSGGFRAVTGEIGDLHKENYSIRTPNATVGILGTDHETVFVSASQPGQTAGVAPGTYDHVYSGATVLQSEKSKVLIQPSQTGFAALNGTGPILLDKPLLIFGDLKAGTEESGERHGDMGNSGKENKGNNGSSDSKSASEQNLRVIGNNGSTSGAEQNSSNPGTEQNKITQPDHLSNSTLDLNTLENDASPAPLGSAVVGAHMVAGLRTVGSAQAGNPGEMLLVEGNLPGSYSNNASGFNFIANEGGEPISLGTATVDGLKVTWGIYAGGTSFDTSGNAITVNFHPFAYANGGATPLSVISSIGGSATFSTVVGNTPPVTESGNLGGSVNLNVGINLGTATLTSYILNVADANSRNWTGTLNNSVPLSTFAQSGTTLAVTCSGASCGSGTGSGLATGLLVGPNAKGLISSYVVSTTTGQAVAGAAIISRP